MEGSRFVLEQDLDDAELDHALGIILEDCVHDWPYFSHGMRKHREFLRIWRGRQPTWRSGDAHAPRQGRDRGSLPLDATDLVD